jgi:hypothetical protein
LRNTAENKTVFGNRPFRPLKAAENSFEIFIREVHLSTPIKIKTIQPYLLFSSPDLLITFKLKLLR